VGHHGWQFVIESQPDETFGELMQRKQAWHGGKQEFSPMLDFGDGGHSNGSEDGAADKVGAS
jgi:hypothetical protein